METIISAIISAGAAIIVCAISNNRHNALMAYRLEQLEEKMNKHNNFIERGYNLEQKVGIDELKIKNNEEKIGELEQYHK